MSRFKNQSICDDCWIEKSGDRYPVRLIPEVAELCICAYCGKKHRSGIWVRDRVDNVKYPQSSS